MTKILKSTKISEEENFCQDGILFGDFTKILE